NLTVVTVKCQRPVACPTSQSLSALVRAANNPQDVSKVVCYGCQLDNGDSPVVGIKPTGSACWDRPLMASAHRLMTTASPLSGDRPRRATTSSLASTRIFGGTPEVTSQVGVVRSEISRSSGGRASTGS